MAKVIQDQILKLKSMLKNVDQITIRELERNPQRLVQMNRAQLMQGINADGGSMPNYAASNKKKSGKINLFDKGDFQRGITTMFDDQGLDMTSADDKSWFLDPFRKVINTLGLTDGNIDKWLNNAIPNIIKKLKTL